MNKRDQLAATLVAVLACILSMVAWVPWVYRPAFDALFRDPPSRVVPPGHYEIDASELARSNEEQDRARVAATGSGYTYAYGFVGRDGGRITVSSDELHDLVEWGLQQKNQGCICLRAGVLHPSVDVIDGVFPGTMSNGSMWMPKGTAWWPDGGFMKEPGVSKRLDKP